MRLQSSSLPTLQAVILHRQDWIDFKRPLVRFEKPEVFWMFFPKLYMRLYWPNLLYLCCGNSGLVLCHTPHTFQFHCVSSAGLQHLPALRGLRQKQTGWVTGREDTEPQQGQKWVCVLKPGLCSLFRVGQVRLSPTRHRLGLFCLVASLASAGLGWQAQR